MAFKVKTTFSIDGLIMASWKKKKNIEQGCSAIIFVFERGARARKVRSKCRNKESIIFGGPADSWRVAWRERRKKKIGGGDDMAVGGCGMEVGCYGNDKAIWARHMLMAYGMCSRGVPWTLPKPPPKWHDTRPLQKQTVRGDTRGAVPCSCPWGTRLIQKVGAPLLIYFFATQPACVPSTYGSIIARIKVRRPEESRLR